jgi:hypothetical protein
MVRPGLFTASILYDPSPFLSRDHYCVRSARTLPRHTSDFKDIHDALFHIQIGPSI